MAFAIDSLAMILLHTCKKLNVIILDDETFAIIKRSNAVSYNLGRWKIVSTRQP